MMFRSFREWTAIPDARIRTIRRELRHRILSEVVTFPPRSLIRTWSQATLATAELFFQWVFFDRQREESFALFRARIPHLTDQSVLAVYRLSAMHSMYTFVLSVGGKVYNMYAQHLATAGSKSTVDDMVSQVFSYFLFQDKDWDLFNLFQEAQLRNQLDGAQLLMEACASEIGSAKITSQPSNAVFGLVLLNAYGKAFGDNLA